MKKHIELEIKIPMTPNFILCGENSKPVAIAEFTEKELRDIGKEWIDNLVAKAKKRSIAKNLHKIFSKS